MTREVSQRIVIGCVWGAHRKLVETFGDEAPPYDWCEQEWSSRLSKTAPAPSMVPDWLYQELLFAWRAQTPRQIEHQMQLPLWLNVGAS